MARYHSSWWKCQKKCPCLMSILGISIYVTLTYWQCWNFFHYKLHTLYYSSTVINSEHFLKLLCSGFVCNFYKFYHQFKLINRLNTLIKFYKNWAMHLQLLIRFSKAACTALSSMPCSFSLLLLPSSYQFVPSLYLPVRPGRASESTESFMASALIQ